MEYYSALKRQAVLTHACNMDAPEDLTLPERSQSPEDSAVWVCRRTLEESDSAEGRL
jgi:hypothetical protein